MPNKVEAGMRFRRKDDGKTFTAVREWGKGRSGINGQPDWYVEEDDSHRSLSSDDLYEPIPEPAPELCAQPGCCAGRPVRGPGTRAEHDRSLPEKECCHPFVAPQAKPLIAKPADIYAGPPITGTFHNVQAKPVLREPMPAFPVVGEVWAYTGHEIGEVSKVVNEKIYGDTLYFTNGHPPLFWNDGNSWTRVRPAEPAAKDIPSLAAGTEAARGGEAATFIGIDWGAALACEQGPSAVAAAPGVEPWRPTVDDDFWIPNASEGWRR